MLEEHEELISGLAGALTLLLLVLTVSTAIGAYNKVKEGRYIGRDVEERDTITVSGEGEVYADPDLAVMNFSVVTEKETVEEALGTNKEKMNAVISKLKEDVKEKDIKTTTFNVQPRYEWLEDRTTDKKGERVLVGYEVTQEVKVKLRDLERVGEVIQKATDAGANRLGNIQFTIEDKEEIKKQAREKAISQAEIKAQETASQLEVDLGEVVDFSEKFYTPRIGYNERMDTEQGAGAAPQIEPGQNNVEVNVSVTYEID